MENNNGVLASIKYERFGAFEIEAAPAARRTLPVARLAVAEKHIGPRNCHHPIMLMQKTYEAVFRFDIELINL